MNKFSKYVKLDTHKKTIAVAIADTHGGKARYFRASKTTGLVAPIQGFCD